MTMTIQEEIRQALAQVGAEIEQAHELVSTAEMSTKTRQAFAHMVNASGLLNRIIQRIVDSGALVVPANDTLDETPTGRSGRKGGR